MSLETMKVVFFEIGEVSTEGRLYGTTDRPLTKDGRRSTQMNARLLAEEFKKNGYRPHKILCGTSAQTVQTAQILHDQLALSGVTVGKTPFLNAYLKPEFEGEKVSKILAKNPDYAGARQFLGDYEDFKAFAGRLSSTMGTNDLAGYLEETYDFINPSIVIVGNHETMAMTAALLAAGETGKKLYDIPRGQFKNFEQLVFNTIGGKENGILQFEKGACVLDSKMGRVEEVCAPFLKNLISPAQARNNNNVDVNVLELNAAARSSFSA